MPGWDVVGKGNLAITKIRQAALMGKERAPVRDPEERLHRWEHRQVGKLPLELGRRLRGVDRLRAFVEIVVG